MAGHRETPLSSCPAGLNPNEYFGLSPEQRRVEEERFALRSQLKRQYQIELNNPHRRTLVEDPALTVGVCQNRNIYPNFRPTPKTSLLGSDLWHWAPFLLWYYVH
ncbi:hypothetical protein GDO86_018786 [Hymenochirus boettgeri]|uniref:NADH dehydrogenase [ubiquinone] 1 beta subcomplex subunit 4 n=1 Tax=Hymenochirus boettgeri TaxID=247094 RepID=A0A8T2IIE4_9PIPI|nr:hypothetical protein GDO86_018786 [Hymenochirus boettgeri]